MEQYKTGDCPQCSEAVFFPLRARTVACTACFRRSDVRLVQNAKLLDEENTSGADLENLVAAVLRKLSAGRQPGTGASPDYDRAVQRQRSIPPSLQKFGGWDGFSCKLLGPVMTYYGKGKDGRPFKLSERGLDPPFFDASKTSARAFRIAEADLEVVGYGQDRTGATEYLADTLAAIAACNDHPDQGLAVLHVEGDGHCLVHALSRCIFGREFLWHALRVNLQHHLRQNADRYRAQLMEFLGEDWDAIVAEAGPEYVPADDEEMLGMRNVHIFGLANVLRRPIILLDSLANLQSAGDFGGLFLPALEPLDKCTDPATGKPFLPLVVAWSSAAHNHYVPVTPIAGPHLPRIPMPILPPQAWGNIADEALFQYLDIGPDNCIEVGGTQQFGSESVDRILNAMTEAFQLEFGIGSRLVRDVLADVLPPALTGALPTSEAIDFAAQAFEKGRIVRCLLPRCRRLDLLPEAYRPADLQPYGFVYRHVREQYFQQPADQRASMRFHMLSLPETVFQYDEDRDVVYEVDASSVISKEMLCKDGSIYKQFLAACAVPPQHGTTYRVSNNLTYMYNEFSDSLEFVGRLAGQACKHCGRKNLRFVDATGETQYMDGDITDTPSPLQDCCGFKHFYSGVRYDHHPIRVPVLTMHGTTRVSTMVQWFEGESDPALNSNAHQLASDIARRFLPGEFNTHATQQRIVDQILDYLAKLEREGLKKAPTLVFHQQDAGEAATPAPVSVPAAVPSPLQSAEGKIPMGKVPAAATPRGDGLPPAAAPTRTVPATPSKAPATVPKTSPTGTAASRDKILAAAESQAGGSATAAAAAAAADGGSPKAASPKSARSSNGDGGADGAVKIGLQMPKGRGRLVVPAGTTVGQLQDMIAATEHGVPRSQQRLKVKGRSAALELSDPHAPVQLTHGETIVVDVVAVERAEPPVRRPAPSAAARRAFQDDDDDDDDYRGGGGAGGGFLGDDEDFYRSGSGGGWPTSRISAPGLGMGLGRDRGKRSRAGGRGMYDTDEDMLQTVSKLLTTLLSHYTERDLLPGGTVYETAVRRLGPLQDKQVVELAELPGKIFRFSAAEGRLIECQRAGDGRLFESKAHTLR